MEVAPPAPTSAGTFREQMGAGDCEKPSSDCGALILREPRRQARGTLIPSTMNVGAVELFKVQRAAGTIGRAWAVDEARLARHVVQARRGGP